jgi:P27 family predicted phage terminase small subunit
MGRRPKPTVIKILQGNPGKRPLGRREPQPPLGVPPCPRHLRGLARVAWHRIGKQLARMGVATTVDQDALELLVRAYAEYCRAQAVVDRRGDTYTIQTASGRVHRARPEVAIAQDAWRRARLMLIEFGLTPAARARVELDPPTEDTAANDVEHFLFGLRA